MASSVDLSPELEDWVRRAGLDMIQGSQTNDGRTVIWNTNGEVRYFVDRLDGWYVVTSSDRMGAETFGFAGQSMTVVEKYLYGVFGASVRDDQLPGIRTPFERGELRPDYTVAEQEFFGRKRHTLIDQAGKVIAIAGVEDLVELSHYLDCSIDDIRNSYLSSDGKPLFGLWRDVRN